MFCFTGLFRSFKFVNTLRLPSTQSRFADIGAEWAFQYNLTNLFLVLILLLIWLSTGPVFTRTGRANGSTIRETQTHNINRASLLLLPLPGPLSKMSVKIAFHHGIAKMVPPHPQTFGAIRACRVGHQLLSYDQLAVTIVEYFCIKAASTAASCNFNDLYIETVKRWENWWLGVKPPLPPMAPMAQLTGPEW